MQALIIVGLIVYVVFSIVAEAAKSSRRQTPPTQSRTLPQGMGPSRPATLQDVFQEARRVMEDDDEGVSGESQDYNEGPSELDLPSQEGEWSGLSTEGEGLEEQGVDGSLAGGEAFEGPMVSMRPKAKDGEAAFWADGLDEAGESSFDDFEADRPDTRSRLLEGPDDVVRSVIMSEVLSRRRGSHRMKVGERKTV